MSIWFGFCFLILVNAIDAYLTKEILDRNGVEFNPIMKWVIGKYGYKGMIYLKMLVAFLMLTGILSGRIDSYTVWFLVTIFAYVNFKMFRELKNMKTINKMNA
ncbi:MAG: DUF5658 family protein [Pseudoalteromonas sp.]|uniref:DUF5658 family protein n=1 Tax=Pseudoalteromonas sp. TaxID=53249 RepID=UPI0025D535BB|nr:DUF5658 family protein [Pseudoalteromonas sp.]MCH2089502.1 DUF5658 family protein [Pseudoalteromonas sp.]